MQQEASKKLGFQTSKTMRAAQQLYEGVEIEGMGAVGLITYMRTDSLRISDEARSAAYKYIEGAYGKIIYLRLLRYTSPRQAHRTLTKLYVPLPPRLLQKESRTALLPSSTSFTSSSGKDLSQARWQTLCWIPFPLISTQRLRLQGNRLFRQVRRLHRAV